MDSQEETSQVNIQMNSSHFKKIEKEQEKKRKMEAKLEKDRLKMEAKAEKELRKSQANAIRDMVRISNKTKQLMISRAKKEGIKEGIRLERERVKTKEEKKVRRNKSKHEIHDNALRKMLQVADVIERTYPRGATAKDVTDAYVELHGRINPYTLEQAPESYNMCAAIRGFMYETSPSSEQHWFRYGVKKVREQVAPWIFANKELAKVNNEFEWKVSTPEMSSARRQNKGLWIIISKGSLAFYNWNEEKYGPLPTEDILIEASKNRKIGVRSKNIVFDIVA
jgi:hypothetical protein